VPGGERPVPEQVIDAGPAPGEVGAEQEVAVGEGGLGSRQAEIGCQLFAVVEAGGGGEGELGFGRVDEAGLAQAGCAVGPVAGTIGGPGGHCRQPVPWQRAAVAPESAEDAAHVYSTAAREGNRRLPGRTVLL
jgi:hypothetical protein